MFILQCHKVQNNWQIVLQRAETDIVLIVLLRYVLWHSTVINNEAYLTPLLVPKSRLLRDAYDMICKIKHPWTFANILF